MAEQNVVEKCTFLPSDGTRQSFAFHLKVKNYETVYNGTPFDQPIEFKFENLVVGDKDVVFNLFITIDEYLSIKMIRTSQRLEDVTIYECTACLRLPDNSFAYQMDYPVTTLKAGSDDELLSTMNSTLSWKWYEAVSMYHAYDDWDGSIEIRFRGRAFYPQPVKQSLQMQMKNHLSNPETGDVTLTVGSETFKAHKWLLSTRSPVFQAMFNSNMRESAQNTVKLTDENPNMFREVLEFIYTDKCSNLSTMAPDLLFSADKYNIEGLRSLCETEMMKHLCVDNVCHYLIKSSMTNSNRIYEKCLKFFGKHRKDVLKTEGWATLKASPSSSRFMSDIIQKL